MSPAEGPGWLRREPERLVLALRVQPRAARTGIAEVTAERLRVRVQAPPVEGAANRELCTFLAREFRVPKSSVEVLSGSGARDKRVSVRAPRRWPEWLENAPGR